MSNINRSIKSPITSPAPYDPIAQLLALPHPPPTLQLGSSGKDAWAVRLFHRLMAAWSYATPKWLDQSNAVPGVFADLAPALLHSFQRDHQLLVDGVCGPETWAWLGCRNPRDLGEVALTFARADAYACAREIGGNNRGEWVKRYCGWTGAKAEWCAGAATTWINEARARLGLPAWDWGPNRLSSSALVKHAYSYGSYARLYHPQPTYTESERKCKVHVFVGTPRPGDLCIVRGGPTGYRHCTVLDHVEGGRAYVIEGNVRPLAWLTDALWRALGRPAGIVRPGSYPLRQVVFVRSG